MSVNNFSEFLEPCYSAWLHVIPQFCGIYQSWIAKEQIAMTQGYLEFRQGMPFFDMVGSFLIAIAGSPSIINEDNPMKLDERHYVAIPGIVVPGRHIRPREVHDQVVKGHISQGQFLKSCCGMLANTAYESVKNRLDPPNGEAQELTICGKERITHFTTWSALETSLGQQISSICYGTLKEKSQSNSVFNTDLQVATGPSAG